MIRGEEILWLGLKEQGHFQKYDTYSEYTNRHKKETKKSDIIDEEKIEENIKKSEEIEFSIANYNPKPTNKEEQEEKERKEEEEDKEWRMKHLLTDEHRRIFDSW